MADKAPMLQQPVISIRISDELRLRLETLKEIMAARSGEPVSTSEAAKQLLESSKEERLEFVNLLSEPTDSLVKIRGKADAKLPLLQAEWTLVAYYCQRVRSCSQIPARRIFLLNLSPEFLKLSLPFMDLYPNRERGV